MPSGNPLVSGVDFGVEATVGAAADVAVARVASSARRHDGGGARGELGEEVSWRVRGGEEAVARRVVAQRAGRGTLYSPHAVTFFPHSGF